MGIKGRSFLSELLDLGQGFPLGDDERENPGKSYFLK